MAMATSTFSPPASQLSLTRRRLHPGPDLLTLSSPRLRAGLRLARAAAGEAPVETVEAPPSKPEADPSPAASNGAAVKAEKPAAAAAAPPLPKFRDSRWVNGTWDLRQFEKGGAVDWDAVIDAGEAQFVCLPIPLYASVCCCCLAAAAD